MDEKPKTFLREEVSIPEKRSNSSRFKGVTAAAKGHWQAQARRNDRQFHLGYFTSEEAAAIARNEWDISQGFPPSNVIPEEWTGKVERLSPTPPKLTEDQVRLIYELAWSGRYTLQVIANTFQISPTQVRRIKHREGWGHLWDERPEWTTPQIEELSPSEWQAMQSGPGEWKDVIPERETANA